MNSGITAVYPCARQNGTSIDRLPYSIHKQQRSFLWLDSNICMQECRHVSPDSQNLEREKRTLANTCLSCQADELYRPASSRDIDRSQSSQIATAKAKTKKRFHVLYTLQSPLIAPYPVESEPDEFLSFLRYSNCQAIYVSAYQVSRLHTPVHYSYMKSEVTEDSGKNWAT